MKTFRNTPHTLAFLTEQLQSARNSVRKLKAAHIGERTQKRI